MRDRSPKMLVLGIGNPSCGDEAVGPAVAKRIRHFDENGVHTQIVPSDASSIIAAMKGFSYVVIVDAIHSRGATGAMHVFDASRRALPSGLFEGYSTHEMGLDKAIEMARELGGLPPKLVVLGIEGSSFEPGDPMSPRVEAAIENAVSWIFERCESFFLAAPKR